MLSQTYAGIGSRETPKDILFLMSKIAFRLEQLGFTLRSGGAKGADTAFQKGTRTAEIYLPKQYFNGNVSDFHTPDPEAFKITKRFHPAYNSLSDFAKLLMARNAHQILGPALHTPCLFVVCWTQDGCEHSRDRTFKTGGTGQAISIASGMNIPIFNLKNPNALERLKEFLSIWI